MYIQNLSLLWKRQGSYFINQTPYSCSLSFIFLWMCPAEMSRNCLDGIYFFATLSVNGSVRPFWPFTPLVQVVDLDHKMTLFCCNDSADLWPPTSIFRHVCTFNFFLCMVLLLSPRRFQCRYVLGGIDVIKVHLPFSLGPIWLLCCRVSCILGCFCFLYYIFFVISWYLNPKSRQHIFIKNVSNHNISLGNVLPDVAV